MIESIPYGDITLSVTKYACYFSLKENSSSLIVRIGRIMRPDGAIQFYCKSPRSDPSEVETKIVQIYDAHTATNRKSTEITIRDGDVYIFATGDRPIRSWARMRLHQVVWLFGYMPQCTLSRNDGSLVYTATYTTAGDRYCYELIGQDVQVQVGDARQSLLRVRIGQYFPRIATLLQNMIPLLPCDMSATCRYDRPYLHETDAAITTRTFSRLVIDASTGNTVACIEVKEYSLQDENIVVAIQTSSQDTRVITKLVRPTDETKSCSSESVLSQDAGASCDEFMRIAIVCGTPEPSRVSTIIAMFQETVQRIFTSK